MKPVSVLRVQGEVIDTTMASINDIAEWLRADLGTLGERWSAEVVAEGGLVGGMQRDAARLGLPLGEPLPQAVSIRVDDVEDLRVVFWSGLEFMEQVVNAMGQIQDFVAEVTTEEWPRCPRHRHALLPRNEAGSIGWACPSASQVVVSLGELSQLK
jgi:hypothetical protein